MNGDEEGARRLEELENRQKELEEQQQNDHDLLIRHNCDLTSQMAQGDHILKRLEEQDTKDEKTKDEILGKVDWVIRYVLTAMIGVLLSGLVYVVFLHRL